MVCSSRVDAVSSVFVNRQVGILASSFSRLCSPVLLSQTKTLSCPSRFDLAGASLSRFRRFHAQRPRSLTAVPGAVPSPDSQGIRFPRYFDVPHLQETPASLHQGRLAAENKLVE